MLGAACGASVSTGLSARGWCACVVHRGDSTALPSQPQSLASSSGRTARNGLKAGIPCLPQADGTPPSVPAALVPLLVLNGSGERSIKEEDRST